MMAFRRDAACCLLLALVLTLQLTAGHAAGNVGDVAIYWGRNSRDEGTLRQTCDTGKYNTVIISFLVAFGHGNYRLDLSGRPLAGVGDDIKYCKSKHVEVLLSIGGQGGEYSLPTSQSAWDVAFYLWNAFLGGYHPRVYRPFGDAVVDGIDFFIDQGGREHYHELAGHLRRWGVKLTAAPRCAYPDHRLDEALATGLFSRIYVRVYGEDRTCAQTPVDSWKKWAEAYPNSKVFFGAVAAENTQPATFGYIPPEKLRGLLMFLKSKWGNYGGVMIWNRYYDKKTGFTDRLLK